MRNGPAINARGGARVTPSGRRGITQFTKTPSLNWLTHRIALERQKTLSVYLLVPKRTRELDIELAELASSATHIPPVGLAVLHSRTQFYVTHRIIKKISIARFDTIVFSVGAGLVLVVGRMPVSRPRLVFMRPCLAAE